jgi:hypothetical protein
MKYGWYVAVAWALDAALGWTIVAYYQPGWTKAGPVFGVIVTLIAAIGMFRHARRLGRQEQQA